MGRHDLYGMRISISEAEDNDNGHYQSFFLFCSASSIMPNGSTRLGILLLAGLYWGTVFYGAISKHIQSELPPVPP